MATAKKPTSPKADIVLDDSEFDPHRYECPWCGGTSWSRDECIYEPGKATVTYTCCNNVRGRECGFKVRVLKDIPSLVWVAPNQKWLIYDAEPRSTPDPEDPDSIAGSVILSDTWSWGGVDIDFRGRIFYDHRVMYGAPQYVYDKAESILKAKLRAYGSTPSAKSKGTGKAKSTVKKITAKKSTASTAKKTKGGRRT